MPEACPTLRGEGGGRGGPCETVQTGIKMAVQYSTAVTNCQPTEPRQHESTGKAEKHHELLTLHTKIIAGILLYTFKL